VGHVQMSPDRLQHGSCNVQPQGLPLPPAMTSMLFSSLPWFVVAVPKGAGQDDPLPLGCLRLLALSFWLTATLSFPYVTVCGTRQPSSGHPRSHGPLPWPHNGFHPKVPMWRHAGHTTAHPREVAWPPSLWPMVGDQSKSLRGKSARKRVRHATACPSVVVWLPSS
jgi:hypothetical protein